MLEKQNTQTEAKTLFNKIAILNFMNAIIMLDMTSQQWEYITSHDARSLNAYFDAHRRTFTEANIPLAWNYCCEYNRSTHKNYEFLADIDKTLSSIVLTKEEQQHKCRYCLLAGYAWNNKADGCLRMSSQMNLWKYASTKEKRNKHSREIIQACAKVHIDLMKEMLGSPLYPIYTSSDFRSTSGISEGMFTLVDSQINKYNDFLKECYL